MFKTKKRKFKASNICSTLLLLSSLWLAACGDESNATPQGTFTPSLTVSNQVPSSPTILAASFTPDTSNPSIVERLEQQQNALKEAIPVIQLKDGLDENQRNAQDIAVQNNLFQQFMYAPNSQNPVRSEIFGVYPWRDSDLTSGTAGCPQTTCYRVEMYNYAFNLTAFAVVDVKSRTVLEVNHLSNAQPDIPEHLKQLALNIATNAPQVKQALGFKPDASQALMANTKTALNRTRCERSTHLCVAPTFVQGEDALWAIVDLTDLRLVGMAWTNLGQSSRLPVTEKNLQDQLVTKNFCEKNTAFKGNGWAMNYILTSSDGLRISDVTFNGKPVLANAKLVDWHVSYSRQQGFGYSDAVGCPVFSQAAVVAIGGPQIMPITSPNGGAETGVALVQDFWSIGWPAPCNYNYQQRFEFYNDGRFRTAAASIGRGCGNDGTYRPVTRIRWAGEQNNFSEWTGTGWSAWPTEKWQSQTAQTAYTPEGYQFRIADPSGKGYYVEPGRGQFGDGGRGDNAFSYVTRYHPDLDEGESDLVTLGPCCNTDYHQGPETFIEPNPEPISNTNLVMWYVSQQKNSDTPGQEYCWAQSALENGILKVNKFPCYSGPMFVPIT